MTMELREAGLDVGEHRVGRMMKDNGIRPVRTRRHKVTTDSHHQSDIAANLLDGDFLADGPPSKNGQEQEISVISGLPRTGFTSRSSSICSVVV
ncbi:hypothetical protein SRCM100623_00432 [Acetobacter pasteurianus]|uniref:HTH-like domain-containing protein n=2 Tax=Acetobacter pasteurianus TaxID=438 RepID=A0A1A0DJP1_ACEPA|nr:hypothetical protein SRCM100623_00432 [Acetobacter pasteurianus]GCD51281.1 hypothetical protein NBRC106471_2837 [Acetobacter pasteurianus subsp. pasteurianus LMG 1262 = NBRC 106471]